MSVLGGNLLAMGCIATVLRGGGPLVVSVCATSTREGPLRGVQPLTCGGAVPCTQAAVWHHAREGWCWRVPPLSLLFLTLFRAVVANYNQSIAIFTVYSHHQFTYRLGSLRTLSGPHRAISFLLRRARGGKYYIYHNILLVNYTINSILYSILYYY